MARLYANENFPFPTVVRLRELGHDVLTVQETGKSEQAWPDEEVLKFATNEERAVVTLNRKHFVRLHDLLPQHAGILVCTFDAKFESLAERIHEALSKQGALAAQLIRINRPQS